LPDYRGCMPSFWYLFNGEKTAGASVHYMSSAIDDGDVILQEPIDISGCNSMFEVMNLTKKLGGELMIKAIKQIERGEVVRKPNDHTKGRYYTWPTKIQGKELLRKGKKLI